MTRLLTFLCVLLPWLAHGQMGLRSPVVLCNLKPMSAASFPSGATHYWRFSDNLNDSVGSCALVDEGVDSYVAGKNGQCVVLVAGGGVSADCSLSLETAFSIGVWVWPETGSTAAIRGSSGPIEDTVSMYDDAGTWKARGGLTSDIITGGSVTYDAWNLLIITYDGSSVFKFSSNGATFGTGSVTVEDGSGTVVFYTLTAPSRFDEVFTFTRALTQQEVTDIYSPSFGP